MKIIQFITRMDVLGGAQIHVLELSKELVSNGHHVTVLGFGTGELTKELEQSGITYRQLIHVVVPISPLRDLAAFFEVRKVMKEVNPDVIALHSSKAGILGRLAGKSLNIPTVFTAHGWSFAAEGSEGKQEFLTRIEKIAGKFVNGVIAVSEFDYKQAVLKQIVPEDKIQMIHNGIHDCMPEGEVRKMNRSVVNILMVARFAEPKDHILLLQALSQVDTCNWHLTFIGGGPLVDQVKEVTDSLQLAGNVSFSGECRDVTAKLREADIFALASKSEGLPISIIEAMREGLPIIASDVGGIKELIDHEKSGLLVEKGDESGWIQALRKMIGSEDYRKELGKAARKKFIAQFIFTEMYLQTEAFYEEIASSKKGRQFI